jgi:phenylacetate-CoA ligase
MISTPAERRQLMQLERGALEALQLAKLKTLVAEIKSSPFFAQKLSGISAPLTSLGQLRELPFTTKDELIPTASEPLLPRHHTAALGEYVRFHQTSGTRGRPLPVLDTAADWQWWIECWQYVLDAAEVTGADRALLAFSFGPFIGFWSAFDALVERGALVIPGGGLSSRARLDLIARTQPNVLLCTPSYSLRLAEVGLEAGIRLGDLGVKKIIVAGEPGGSVPATRSRIEATWNATVIDHAGATEIGAWGFGDAAGSGLYGLESEFLFELLRPTDNQPAAPGELAQLVITSLGRRGCPVLRYRTGDLVRAEYPSSGDCRFVHFPGGVLGRADEMLVVRGVNVYPSAIEQIVHGFPEVIAYRLTIRKRGELDELLLEVEDRMQRPERIASELELRLGLHVEVTLAPPMSLPRSEGKRQTLVDAR